MRAGFLNDCLGTVRQMVGTWPFHAWRQYACVLVALTTLGLSTSASAVVPLLDTPDIAQLSRSAAHVSVDMRKLWQSAVIGVGNDSTLPNTKASDPDQLWNTPDAEFKTTAVPDRMTLKPGQRLVSRLNMNFTSFGPGMNLSFMMPRLDAVHVAYRYGLEPWTRASAGDTLPMTAWAYSDRQPTFDIPLRPGNLNVVTEIAHLGLLDAPVLLQSASSFRDQRMLTSLRIGLLVGLNLLMAVVGVAAALSFGRLGFLSITVMASFLVAMVVANSGIAGIYMLTSSAVFNDQAKFVTAVAWCALFPWVTAMALSLRLQSPRWWVVSVLWAGVVLLAALVLKSNLTRSENVLMVPLFALGSVALAVAILGQALLRQHPHAPACVLPVLLYALSIALPMASYLGLLQDDSTFTGSAAATVIAAMLFMRVLVRQYRQGRTVMSRAQSSPSRDVLTGLLSRKGFEQVQQRNVQRMKSEQTYAAFFYIKVSDPEKLKERYGQEGFEGGMVQLAAAISSSISVVDTVGRVAPNAFAVMVLMPRDAGLANRLSQKILTRMISLASHGAPLAQTARIAVAWMPIFGILLPDLERRAMRALRKMEEGKRITWVGGAMAQADVSQLQESLTSPTTKPHGGQEADELPSLPGTINRLEREMLGPDSKTLQDEADSLMAAMKSKSGDLASIAGELRR